MGLPRELVDYIMDMLHDDFPTLKACSLTCKAMFASTRRLIHQTLLLTRGNNQRVLTRKECDLLKYTRLVHVRDPGIFTPETLQLPHLHYFHSLNRVHTLTVEHYDAASWEKHYAPCLSHLYPTLTSLALSCRPHGHYRAICQFILQFPNLENVSLERLQNEVESESSVPTTVDRFPPLRGHLRLAFLSSSDQWLMNFARDFRTRINFRSVELETSVLGDHTRRILKACAHTLQFLTIATPGTGTHRLLFPVLAKCGRAIG